MKTKIGSSWEIEEPTNTIEIKDDKGHLFDPDDYVNEDYRLCFKIETGLAEYYGPTLDDVMEQWYSFRRLSRKDPDRDHSRVLSVSLLTID